jgi:hypothetical protein
VSDLAPFGHLDDVAADDREAHDVVVEVTRAVEVPGREPDVREPCSGGYRVRANRRCVSTYPFWFFSRLPLMT